MESDLLNSTPGYKKGEKKIKIIARWNFLFHYKLFFVITQK